MDDSTPPRPFPSPPDQDIETAVRDHIDVAEDIRHLKLTYATLCSNVARLADAQTVDRLGQTRLTKQVTRLEAVVRRFEVTAEKLEKVPDVLERLAKLLGAADA